MNKGMAIFKRAQRLQGGGDVPGPNNRSPYRDVASYGDEADQQQPMWIRRLNYLLTGPEKITNDPEAISPFRAAVENSAPVKMFNDWQAQRAQQASDESSQRMATIMQQAFKEAADKIDARRRADEQDLVPSPYGLDDMPARLTAPYRPGAWAGMQGGTEAVQPYKPLKVDPTEDYPFTTDEEFIKGRYPHETQNDDLAHLTPEEQAQEQRDWENNIKSILTSTPDLTPEERDQVLRLNPKDWDDSTREKVGAASEQAGKDIQLQKGTSNIMSMQTTGNNPGLNLFMAKVKGTRPKLLIPHPARARLPNAAQLNQSIEPPPLSQGLKKGSSGIHIKPSHKGLFTAKAKGAGMGVQQYASKVLSPSSNASPQTKKQANFARNAAKWQR